MSYEKQTWANGDLISAEKLNHIEDGISQSGGTLTVNVTVTEDAHGNEIRTLDKTYNEITSADTVKIESVDADGSLFYLLAYTEQNEGKYMVGTINIWINPVSQEVKGEEITYYADSVDGVLDTQQDK